MHPEQPPATLKQLLDWATSPERAYQAIPQRVVLVIDAYKDAIKRLTPSELALAAAVSANEPKHSTAGGISMPAPNPILDPLEATVTSTVGTIQSAVTLINGISTQIANAVSAAIANGATADQLAPLTDLNTQLAAQSSALAAAVAANTPPVSPPTP